MSLDQVIREAVLKLSVQSKTAEKELKDFTKASDATAKSLGAVSVQSLHVQKALDTVGLGAENQVPRLTRMHSAFQGITGKLGQGIGALDNFAKRLAPWNAAVELGGKALDGINAGLDAYAKRSPEAAAEVKELRDAFGSLKDAVLGAAGGLVVDLAQGLGIIEGHSTNLIQQWHELEGSKFLKIVTGAPGGIDEVQRTQRWMKFLTGGAEAHRSRESLGYILGGGFIKDLDDNWATANVTFDAVTDKLGKITAASKKAGEENARWAAEFRAQQLKSTQGRNYINPNGGFSIEGVGGATSFSDKSGFLSLPSDQEKSALDKAMQSLYPAETATPAKGPTFLERLGLNDPSAMSTALVAVQGLTSGMTAAFQALGEGTLGAGDAFKKGLGIMIHALGDKLAAMAAAEAVEGAAMLVTLNPAGALHLAAAGLLGTGAIAAYAASAKLGGGGGSVPGTPGAMSARSHAPPPQNTNYLLSSGPSGSPGGTTVINQYIGSSDDNSPRMRQRRAERMINLGMQHTSVGGAF